MDYYSWSDEDAEDASPFGSDTDDLSDEGGCDYLLLSKGYTSSTSYVYPLALWLSELAHSTVIKLNEQKLSTRSFLPKNAQSLLQNIPKNLRQKRQNDCLG